MKKSPLNPDEKAALKPSRSFKPSEWAEEYRIVSKPSPMPGKWRNSYSPFLTGIMDAITLDVAVIVLMKSAQIGFSELVRNILGFWIDQEPGDCLFILPNEQAGKELFEERIKPLVKTTPKITAHLGTSQDDMTMTRVIFDTMSLYLGWSGSPQSLASRSIRYLICDEVDKYATNIKKEADPISLGLKRLRKYGDRALAIIGSTPTLDTGNIAKQFQACGLRYYFYIPCPSCQKFQTLVFSQVKWDKSAKEDGKTAYRDSIESNPSSAWYVCKYCDEKISDAQKNRAMKAGVWASEDAPLDDEGRPISSKLKTKRIGFHISALYDPAVRFSDIVANWIDCEGDYGKTIDFYNSTLGQPYEARQAKIESKTIRTLASFGMDTAGQSPVLPAWTTGLFASADTQQDRFYYVVRAWGKDYRSQLITYGIAYTFEELYQRTIGTAYIHPALETMRNPAVLLIDSGGTVDQKRDVSRTAEVYQFGDRHPADVIPLKGMDASQSRGGYSYMAKIQGREFRFFKLQTHYFKSYLSNLIKSEIDGIPKWLPLKNIDDDYQQQMSSNHLVKDRQTGQMEWKTVTAGRADHYFDAEVYNVAYADYVKIGSYETQDVLQPAIPAEAANHQDDEAYNHQAQGPSWANKHKGKYG